MRNSTLKRRAVHKLLFFCFFVLTLTFSGAAYSEEPEFTFVLNPDIHAFFPDSIANKWYIQARDEINTLDPLPVFVINA
ncbi:MAG: hypothetical protein WC955_10570, partial [Elusimicrobiota bacterium]